MANAQVQDRVQKNSNSQVEAVEMFGSTVVNIGSKSLMVEGTEVVGTRSRMIFTRALGQEDNESPKTLIGGFLIARKTERVSNKELEEELRKIDGSETIFVSNRDDDISALHSMELKGKIVKSCFRYKDNKEIFLGFDVLV